MKQDLFWTLLEPEHGRAEAFCRRLAGSRDDGDDLYQDSLLAAISRFETLRDQQSFRPWLYSIIINRFKNLKRRPWWRLFSTLSEDGAIGHCAPHPEAGHAHRRTLERAFRAVSAEDRALLVAFEVEGWPIGELSQSFGKPEGTIKARLWRARAKMREAILEQGRLDQGRLEQGRKAALAAQQEESVAKKSRTPLNLRLASADSKETTL